jgi:2-keto-4-pentenoate hydratase/2-oxohepta-3-ene-1,7-dioic acid hydratase in catechol pathway
MRLVSFWSEDRWNPGIQLDDTVFGVSDLCESAGLRDVRLDSSRAVLSAGDGVWSELNDLAAKEADRGLLEPVGQASDLRLGPPVPDPLKIICLGLNYRDHAEEAGLSIPDTPMFFAKFANSLIGPRDAVELPRISKAVDYEAELAVVIGKTAKHVAESEAESVIAGVMVFNDISARDLQNQTSQWTAGKAIDTFAPCGPALVSLDEVGGIADLGIRARVNGTVVQDSTTAKMIFSPEAAIAYLSRFMTLSPGDIIATGTPAGVGFTREPPILLGPGDVGEVEVDGVGVISNPMIESPDSPAPGI